MKTNIMDEKLNEMKNLKELTDYPDNMDEAVYHAEDNPDVRNRRSVIDALHKKIIAGADAEDTLWQAIIACEGSLFCTFSGLPFQYKVKRKRNGDYSGELVINRKEGSKTLTRSSVMYAFHIVRNQIRTENLVEKDGCSRPVLVLPEYKGPKAIGQIFGISYVYSLFWTLGLIRAPEKVEKKMRGK